MGRVVFLVEEPSIHEALRGIIPKLFPDWREYEHWQCVPHEGKSDLQKSTPRKLRAWREPGVILRDLDGADCIIVKENLRKICHEAGRPDTLIRIVCNELESWFLGDMAAVSSASGNPKLRNLNLKAKFREPDKLQNAAKELRKLLPQYSKVSGARDIAKHMNINVNKSHSFGVFAEGLRTFVFDMEKDERNMKEN